MKNVMWDNTEIRVHEKADLDTAQLVVASYFFEVATHLVTNSNDEGVRTWNPKWNMTAVGRLLNVTPHYVKQAMILNKLEVKNKSGVGGIVAVGSVRDKLDKLEGRVLALELLAEISIPPKPVDTQDVGEGWPPKGHRRDG